MAWGGLALLLSPLHWVRHHHSFLLTSPGSATVATQIVQQPRNLYLTNRCMPAPTLKDEPQDQQKITLEKVAEYGIAGVLSIAVAETVFWLLSFPVSSIAYYVATGEWINLMEQEGQVKFLAFT